MKKQRYISKECGNNYQVFDTLEQSFWQGCGCSKEECDARCKQLNAVDNKQIC
jgi:predicted nucleic acid-binding Zn ribbon protein